MSTTIDRFSVHHLRASVRGTVLTPEDPGFDDARRVFYQGFDRRPAAIVRVADAEDVARVVTTARATGIDLVVRNGGHSTVGHSSSAGGLVIDLRDMTDLDIDVEGRTAWAQAGLTTGAYTTAVGTHGLATGFGDTGSVGLAGLTLAGGMGYLVRRHGLAIDQLLAAEVVTADGQIRHTDADTHPDLFWALRGGGGNVGVVTRLCFRLHEVPTVTGGMMLLPGSAEALAGVVAAAEAAPETVSAIATTMIAPPMPMIPAEHHGQLVTMVMLAHSGSVDEADEAIAPFRALATPILDTVQTMTYPELFDGVGPPEVVHESARTLFLDTVDIDTAQTVIDHVMASTAEMAVVQLRVLGGAMARVADEVTAFAHRSRRILVGLGAVYTDGAERANHDRWAQRAAAALDQGVPGAYSGFLGDDSPESVRDAYPGDTWERLRQVKRRHDPDNLFRANHNVPPADV